jgi:predicted nucleic acid-binding protein
LSVLLDTSIWSLALRRRPARSTPAQERIRTEWEELAREGRLLILGAIRQEIFSGIRHQAQFDRLRDQLRAFPHLLLRTEHYETAAQLSNACRQEGIAAGPTDALIASVAHVERVPLFTADADFARFRRLLSFELHAPR